MVLFRLKNLMIFSIMYFFKPKNYEKFAPLFAFPYSMPREGLILFSSHSKWLVFYMGQYLYEPDFHNALYLKFIGTYFRPSKTAASITIACIAAKKGTLL